MFSEYFKLPENYACLSRTDSQIYAFSSDYRVRDTYELNNFRWLKVGTSTNSYGFTPSVCLPDTESYLIPSELSGFVIVGATIIAAMFVAGLFKVFSR